jgi:hypothetical protein
MWTYKGKPFDSDCAQSFIDDGYIGFVYEITENTTGKKYLGKKLLTTRKKLAPLKGKKFKRVKVCQSDWEKYYGSSDQVKRLIEEHGASSFSREILILCKSKGELSYHEARLQFEKEVLLRQDYYNGIINCRINRSHVKNLWKFLFTTDTL